MNAGADLSDPQTWNGYAYVRGSPMNATDPDGTSFVPCTSPASIGCVGNDPPPKPKDPPPQGLNILEQMLYQTLFSVTTLRLQTQQMLQPFGDWLGAPRDPTCMSSATTGGAAAGRGGGASAGAFFGPADVATVPLGAAAGYVGGAGLGRLGGLFSCMSSSGKGGDSGSGGESSKGADIAIRREALIRATENRLGTSRGKPE